MPSPDPGRNQPAPWERLGAEWLESCPAEQDLRVLADTRLTTGQQCALMAKVASSLPGCSGQSIASRPREVILPLTSKSSSLPHLRYRVSK